MKHQEQAIQQNFIQLEQDTSISIKYVPCHAQDMQAVIRLTLKNAYIETMLHQARGQ